LGCYGVLIGRNGILTVWNKTERDYGYMTDLVEFITGRSATEASEMRAAYCELVALNYISSDKSLGRLY
jgi:hypothetical protein